MQMVEEEEAPTSLPTVTRPRLGEGNSQPSSPLRSTFTPTLPTPAHTTLSNEPRPSLSTLVLLPLQTSTCHPPRASRMAQLPAPSRLPALVRDPSSCAMTRIRPCDHHAIEMPVEAAAP
jgi:hypothetical protein